MEGSYINGDDDKECGIQKEAEQCRMDFLNVFASVDTDKVIMKRMPSLFVQTPGAKPIFTVSDLRDEFEQFRIWSENIGVFALGHDSLDYRLRESSDVREAIVGLLQSLCADLKESLLIPEVLILLLEDREYIKAPPIQISSMDSDDSSDDDEEDLNDSQLTVFEIQSRLDHIVDVVNKLSSLARVIQTSGVRSRIFQAANYVHYDNGTNLTKNFEEKYLPDTLRHRYQLTEPLLSRLSRAISLRRRRFMYQLTHQKNLTYGVEVDHASRYMDSPAEHAVNSTNSPQAGTPARRLAAALRHNQVQSGTARLTRASAPSSVPLESIVSEMIVPMSKSSVETIDTPPPPPLEKGAKYFQCPYCCLLVGADKATEAAWRAHVVNDLQPFVCIEPNCPNPHVVLETWTDWIEHHKWTHAMEWWCEGLESDHPPTRFTAAGDYSKHLLHDHVSEFSSIRSVSKRVRAAGRPSQEPFKCCPFCDWRAAASALSLHGNASEALTIARSSQGELQSHIFSHLLAMFILALRSGNEIEDGAPEEHNWAGARSIWKTDDEGSLDSVIGKLLYCPPVFEAPLPGMERQTPKTDFKDEAVASLPTSSMRMDLRPRIDDIIPNFDGFKTHARQLNPRLEPFLIQRIAFEQVHRYEKLWESKVKHAAAGHVAGGSANLLFPSPRGPPQVFRIIIPGEEEEDDNNDDEIIFRKETVKKAILTPGIPPPPVKRLPATFECTLCFKLKKFYSPSDWTRHVYEDLCPFTCTFTHCSDPKSFPKKDSWIRHENERHRQLEWWKCSISECSQISYRKDHFIQHLVREHAKPDPKVKSQHRNEAIPIRDKAEVGEVWRLVEECLYETTKKPKDEPCKFCGNILPTWKKLNGHLAKHLEQIALPILELVKTKEVLPEDVRGLGDIGEEVPTERVSTPSIVKSHPQT
ncbi:MAG: hypothetical protein Q9227_004990 [Pyrenula ochraceoflavens]